MSVQDLILVSFLTFIIGLILLLWLDSPISDFIADWQFERWKRKRKKPFLDKMKRDLEIWREQEDKQK